MLVYLVKSDNINGWVTLEAYEELRLSMSTGDFHTHRAKLYDLSGLSVQKLKAKDKLYGLFYDDDNGPMILSQNEIDEAESLYYRNHDQGVLT